MNHRYCPHIVTYHHHHLQSNRLQLESSGQPEFLPWTGRIHIISCFEPIHTFKKSKNFSHAFTITARCHRKKHAPTSRHGHLPQAQQMHTWWTGFLWHASVELGRCTPPYSGMPQQTTEPSLRTAANARSVDWILQTCPDGILKCRQKEVTHSLS